MLFYPGGAGPAGEANDMCADEPLQAAGNQKNLREKRLEVPEKHRTGAAQKMV